MPQASPLLLPPANPGVVGAEAGPDRPIHARDRSFQAWPTPRGGAHPAHSAGYAAATSTAAANDGEVGQGNVDGGGLIGAGGPRAEPGLGVTDVAERHYWRGRLAVQVGDGPGSGPTATGSPERDQSE